MDEVYDVIVLGTGLKVGAEFFITMDNVCADVMIQLSAGLLSGHSFCQLNSKISVK